jgi:hypothetical protein
MLPGQETFARFGGVQSLFREQLVVDRLWQFNIKIIQSEWHGSTKLATNFGLHGEQTPECALTHLDLQGVRCISGGPSLA